MKRFVIALALVFAASGVLGSRALAGTGNGAPTGYHFELNIHGVSNIADESTGAGHDIFVPLNADGTVDSQTALDCDDILLHEGATFQVLYPDCLNSPSGSPEFQLPNPNSTSVCPTGYYCTAYTVWVRALTKGSATMQTCYTDTTGTTYCATGAQVLTLTKKATGTNTFQDATQQLLFYCNAATGTLAPIFSPSNYTYFWDYDNAGLKLAQLRFYPATSDQISQLTACTTTNKI